MLEPSSGARRPPFLAVVEPLAAHWLLREIGERAEEYARRAVAYEGTAAAEQGRQLQRALARFEEGVRWWREAQAELSVGTPEVVDVGVVWLSTADVATELGVGVRQVGNYIDKGRGSLPAVLVKGAWRIRADDLADFRNGGAEVPG